MTEIFSSLIIPLVSIIGSFLTVFFTVRCNFKNHINESAFEKRKELYVKFLNLLINIKSNPYLQFEKETLDYLEKIKAEFMIYATPKCQQDFSQISELLQEIQCKYENERKNETAIEEDNLRIEADSTAVFDIQAEDEHYKDENKILDKRLNELSNFSLVHIKKSLGIRS